MSEWPVRTVGRLCESISSGGTPSRAHPEYYDPPSIPWVKTAELLDREIFRTEESISALGLQNSSAKLLPSGTVLMAMYGATVGQLGVLRVPATCNQAACAMVTKDEKSTGRWLYYALLNGRARIVSLATGAAQQNLSVKVVRALKFATPPLPEQRAIAEVLGALDDKIAANRTVISSAMKRAEAEFAQTLVESHEARLGDVLRLEYGKALPAKSRAGGDVAVYGSGGVVGYHDSPLVDGQGVVVGRKGSAGSVYWASAPHFPIDTTYFVVTTDERVCAQFAYFLLKGQDLAGLNADSAVPGLNRNEAYALPIRVPKAPKARRFQQISTVLFAISDAKVEENRRLAATRDALLPLLMSGKVRVKDVEDEVGELV